MKTTPAHYFRTSTLVALVAAACASSASRPPVELQVPRLPVNRAFNSAEFPGPTWAVVSPDELGRYETLYALSDIHGTLLKFTALLKHNGLITPESTPGHFQWQGGRSLLVIVGDFIDKKGENPVGVLLRVQQLQKQAEKSGGRVIALLGNHEAQFLGDPEEFAGKNLLRSAAQYIGTVPGLNGDKVKPNELFRSDVGLFLRSMPVGAIVGDWLFAHSGMIAADSLNSVGKYFSAITKAFEEAHPSSAQDPALEGKIQRAYARIATTNPKLSALLTEHNWCKGAACSDNLPRLHAVGLQGQVVGHEPRLLLPPRSAAKEINSIRMHADGWLIKVDSGMNRESETQSMGYLLKCRVNEILPPQRSSEGAILNMVRDGKPVCRQADALGRESEIPYGRP